MPSSTYTVPPYEVIEINYKAILAGCAYQIYGRVSHEVKIKIKVTFLL